MFSSDKSTTLQPDQAISLLTSAVESRLLNPTPHSRSNHKTFLTPTDVQNVLCQLKDRRKGILPSGKPAEHQADEQINQRLQQNQDVTSQGAARPRNRPDAFTPVNAGNGADTDANHTAGSGDVGEDEGNDEVDGEEDHAEEGGNSDEVNRREDEGEQEDEQTEVSRAGAMKAKPMKELQCGYAFICSALLPSIPPAGDRLDEEEGLKLLEWPHDLHRANFCKITLDVLQAAVWTCTPMSQKTNFRNVSSWSFAIALILAPYGLRSHDTSGMQVELRVVLRLDLVHMYTPIKTDTFTFNAKQVFNRFAGRADAWNTFQEDGTVNIDGVFDSICHH